VQPARALLALVALLVAVGVPAGAFARPNVAAPDPQKMALTQRDVGYVASIEKEGKTTKGLIPATRGYQRQFSGFSPGTVQYLTVNNTVLVGKTPAAAGKLIASIVAASATPSGLASLYKKYAGTIATSLGVPTAGGSVVRAKALKAGDGAAEIVFKFVAPEGDFQGGEVFVSLGGNLSVVTYGTVAPGLAPSQARLFALNAAYRLKQAS
jgi:hypothetical protein